MNNETNQWNADCYREHADFVWRLASPVVELLAPREGEKILDLGCGEGTLGLEIAKSGAEVHGIDLSVNMVRKAKKQGLNARVMDVVEMPYVEAFDAIFSNAVLHWVREPKRAVEHIARALKDGGRFVAEFGGMGNVARIVTAMREVFSHHPEYGTFNDFWYFPSPQEYRSLLEQHGFNVTYVALIPRPTPIDDMAHWLALFSNGVTAQLSHNQVVQFRQEVRERLRATNYTDANGWMADYVRIRVRAVKQSRTVAQT
ncbi:MAG: SAM-dependent methyltransferase [Sulfurimonas sp.]|nr:MAG: SAM-dependent methyltransferase [Sulfurimonas sp.]